MSLRQEQIYAADLRAAIGDYPVRIKWNGVIVEKASFNGGRLSVDAIDGGILDNQTATIVCMIADLTLPLPATGDTFQVEQRDLSWLDYEVATTLEAKDPKGLALTIVAGPVGKP